MTPDLWLNSSFSPLLLPLTCKPGWGGGSSPHFLCSPGHTSGHYSESGIKYVLETWANGSGLQWVLLNEGWVQGAGTSTCWSAGGFGQRAGPQKAGPWYR